MKFHDRQFVEGTEPAIYIGHRVRATANGTLKVSPMWYAEYCLHNRQRFEALGTSNKKTAIQKAHAICTRIQSGQPDRPKQNTTLKQIVDGYLELMKAQGRAPTTITKYDLVGRNVLAWSGDEGRRRAATLMESDFWSIRKYLIETEGVGDKTAYDRLVVVMQMLKWAARQRLVAASPFTDRPTLADGWSVVFGVRPECAPPHRCGQGWSDVQFGYGSDVPHENALPLMSVSRRPFYLASGEHALAGRRVSRCAGGCSRPGRATPCSWGTLRSP